MSLLISALPGSIPAAFYSIFYFIICILSDYINAHVRS